MSLTQTDFENYTRDMFLKCGVNYETMCSKFDSALKDEFLECAHFYYFICTPTKEDVRDEVRIIAITSLIERMVGKKGYKTVFEYFESEFKGQNTIDDFAIFKKEYLDFYGSTGQVVTFFKNYISMEDANPILENLKRLHKGGKPGAYLEDVETLANFFYQMRSDFVHTAQMHILSNESTFAVLDKVGKHYYSIKFDIRALLNLFEKGFVVFWNQKISD